MQNVEVQKGELLQIVQTNRANHRDIFEEALVGYHKALTEALEQRLADVKAGRPVKLYFDLPEPKDQTKDYDRVVRMIEMSVNDHITLTQEEFAQYVMDDWRWRAEFIETTSNYR